MLAKRGNNSVYQGIFQRRHWYMLSYPALKTNRYIHIHNKKHGYLSKQERRPSKKAYNLPQSFPIIERSLPHKPLRLAARASPPPPSSAHAASTSSPALVILDMLAIRSRLFSPPPVLIFDGSFLLGFLLARGDGAAIRVGFSGVDMSIKSRKLEPSLPDVATPASWMGGGAKVGVRGDARLVESDGEPDRTIGGSSSAIKSRPRVEWLRCASLEDR